MFGKRPDDLGLDFSCADGAMREKLGDQSADECLPLVSRPAKVLHFVAVAHHRKSHAIGGRNYYAKLRLLPQL